MCNVQHNIVAYTAGIGTRFGTDLFCEAAGGLVCDTLRDKLPKTSQRFGIVSQGVGTDTHVSKLHKYITISAFLCEAFMSNLWKSKYKNVSILEVAMDNSNLSR